MLCSSKFQCSLYSRCGSAVSSQYYARSPTLAAALRPRAVGRSRASERLTDRQEGVEKAELVQRRTALQSGGSGAADQVRGERAGQLEPERAAVSGFALDADLAAHQSQQLPAQIQTQARAFINTLGRTVYLPKSLIGQIDRRAAELGMSRSSFFGLAASTALTYFPVHTVVRPELAEPRSKVHKTGRLRTKTSPAKKSPA